MAVDITNPDTGEIRTAQIIVAVLGASSYTWAEATWSQQLEDWVMSHVRCFQWLGGVPELVVPDNLKSATSRACKYDPDVNPTYQQMLEHYNVAVIPARPSVRSVIIAYSALFDHGLASKFDQPGT